MAPFLVVVDAISPLRAVLLSTEDQRQRLRTALDDTWTEQTAGCSGRGGRDARGGRGKPSPGGREVFKVGVGVWLSNVRIFFYFHMLITYNMAQACNAECEIGRDPCAQPLGLPVHMQRARCVPYDARPLPRQTFFTLTLLRVVCSWLFVLILATTAPKAVELSPDQVREPRPPSRAHISARVPLEGE